MSKIFEETPNQRRHTDGKYIGRYSTPHIVRELQIKTIMRYHYMPFRMPVTQNTGKTKL